MLLRQSCVSPGQRCLDRRRRRLHQNSSQSRICSKNSGNFLPMLSKNKLQTGPRHVRSMTLCPRTGSRQAPDTSKHDVLPQAGNLGAHGKPPRSASLVYMQSNSTFLGRPLGLGWGSPGGFRGPLFMNSDPYKSLKFQNQSLHAVFPLRSSWVGELWKTQVS